MLNSLLTIIFLIDPKHFAILPYVNSTLFNFIYKSLTILTTVKLGNNDHGYNELTLITNKTLSHFWSQMTGYKDIFHGYNESRL